MIQIDLVTGFLGSGKTTFIKKYVSYLLEQGNTIGILENDFGAVNVDAMLMQDILGDRCTLEMVAGGCDADCHRRRFKTKLIAMGMCGYDRVIVEPSGIFDMDEFFDALHEEPLDRWYDIGNVITIIDAGLPTHLSDASRYLLASQVAQAGAILYSHTQEVSGTKLASVKRYVSDAMDHLHCNTAHAPLVFEKEWADLTKEDFQAILTSGYQTADYVKLMFDEKETYDSFYFMKMALTESSLRSACAAILADPACGKVFRIKGFQKLPDGSWLSVNVTHEKTEIQPIPAGQEILIVIGEHLKQPVIERHWAAHKNHLK